MSGREESVVPITPRLLTEDQAAQMLSLPVATLRREVIRGRVRIGSRIRYDRLELETYVDELSGHRAAEKRSAPLDEDEAELEAFTPIYQEHSGRPSRAKAALRRTGG